MASDLIRLLRLKSLLARSSVRSFLAGSRLRLGVVCGAAALFWLLMFGMFLDVFLFLRKFDEIGDLLTSYLFSFFFMVLLFMMGISNAVIAYTSFYRNEEASLLLSMPVRAESVFAYKSLESLLFSAWGFGTLVVPMVLAYGIVFGAPWHFYGFSFLLAVTFIGLPMEIGAVAALLVPIVIPRRRKVLLVLSGAVVVAALAAWGLAMVGPRPETIFSESSIKRIIGRIAFCQHWALPSQWVSEGMLSSAQGDWRRAGMHLLRLLSNVMFLGLVTCRLGSVLYLRSWAVTHRGSGSQRRRRRRSLLDRAVERGFFLLPRKLRLLVLKDIKTFIRDPVQWSQFLLFFGLLGLYVLNLPRFGLTALQPYWHNLVSLLNLGATCLVLSTLTSRFVYPQLSLEGRRIWIVGLVPVRRRTLLWGKFFFATGGSLLVSGGLIALSDLMLALPCWTVLLHMVVVACVCCGLNGLAVGLGAIYPHMRSDNPSAIVSSFGGTLNLVLSICFIMTCVLLLAVPLHLHATKALTGQRFVFWTAACLAGNVALATVACVLPMKAGIRSFERMEF